MKLFLITVGVFMLVLGLHWIGQGTGLFIWPSNPVMNNHITWAYYGAGMAALGLVLLGLARRRAR